MRLSIDRVLLGVEDVSNLTSKTSGLVFSPDGDAGRDDSVEAGVKSNVRRGMGRRIGEGSAIFSGGLRSWCEKSCTAIRHGDHSPRRGGEIR